VTLDSSVKDIERRSPTDHCRSWQVASGISLGRGRLRLSRPDFGLSETGGRTSDVSSEHRRHEQGLRFVAPRAAGQSATARSARVRWRSRKTRCGDAFARGPDSRLSRCCKTTCLRTGPRIFWPTRPPRQACPAGLGHPRSLHECATAGTWGTAYGEPINLDNREFDLPAICRLEGFRPGGSSRYRRVLVPVTGNNERELAGGVSKVVESRSWRSLRVIFATAWRKKATIRSRIGCVPTSAQGSIPFSTSSASTSVR